MNEYAGSADNTVSTSSGDLGLDMTNANPFAIGYEISGTSSNYFTIKTTNTTNVTSGVNIQVDEAMAEMKLVDAELFGIVRRSIELGHAELFLNITSGLASSKMRCILAKHADDHILRKIAMEEESTDENDGVIYSHLSTRIIAVRRITDKQFLSILMTGTASVKLKEAIAKRLYILDSEKPA